MAQNLIQTNYYNQPAAGTAAASSAKRTVPGFSNIYNSLAKSSASQDSTELDSIFERAANRYGVPLNLLKAVAKTESNYNPNAVSRCGAQGVMQLMPSTAKGLGVEDPLDAEQNIMGGAKYLSQKLNMYDGNVELALASYNAGSGNVAKYGGVPPFKETQNYIKRVLSYAGIDSSYTVSSPAQASTFTSLAALNMLGGSDNSSQNNTNGLDLFSGLTGSGNMNSANYLNLIQLIAAQMQPGAASSESSGLSGLSALPGFGGASSPLGSTQSYLGLLQLITAQMQFGSQPLASDLTSFMNNDNSTSLL